MPRPKVRPEDRQRAPKACVPCKSSKKRCDAQSPCANCLRRNNAEACVYSDLSHHRPNPAAAVRKNQPESRVERPSVGRASIDDSTRSADSPQYGASSVSNGSRLTQAPEGLTSSKVTQARLLLNAKGEKVYIGETASLSFLHFLRQIIKQQMGPSVFTENARRNVMLEVSSPEDANDIFDESFSYKESLIGSYLTATNGLLDLYTREEISRMQSLDATTAAPAELADSATALDLIVAIGAQCRASNQLDLRYATRCFTRAQKSALAGALEDPCIDMVRCFLLMAFYMLGACRRNAAFMYIGVASKAAAALGLHVTEQYQHFNIRDQGVRLRTLKSLRVLDIIVSSILGRPYSTPAIRIDTQAFSSMHVHVGKPRDLALNASFGACSLIAEIMQGLDKDNTIDLSSAERFLQRLRDWSASLPKEIRHLKRNENVPSELDQEQVIGNIHVSCVYYFAVMLVTRPFLISYLMSHLPGSAMESPASTTETGERTGVFNMAEACIDSAIYMAQICSDALRSNLLLHGMCIVKAWMFAAGLVLGFSMFAQGEARFDMEDSFNGARDVLKMLSAHSPQAEHYYEILTSFAEAIQRHRQQLAREKRRSHSRYVNQILSLDVDAAGVDSPLAMTPRGLSQGLADGVAALGPADGGAAGDFGFQEGFQLSDVPMPLEGGGGFDFGMFGWDNFAMQIGENFVFDTNNNGNNSSNNNHGNGNGNSTSEQLWNYG